jgi:hypothetical protein
MNIKRITNPVEFNELIDDLDSLFEYENQNQGHKLLKHNAETIKAAFGHPSILAWDLFVWANKEDGKFDSCIMFFNEKSVKFGELVFSEYLWLSKNPKVGYALFRQAVGFAKKNGFKFISMSTVKSHPKHEKVKSFYERIGLLEDCITYIGKL